MEPEDKGVEVNRTIRMRAEGKGYRECIKQADSAMEAAMYLRAAEKQVSEKALRRCRKAYEEKWGNNK